VHFLAKRDRTQEEFFHTFNSLYQLHRQIILSSDAPPHEIPDLEDRLVSRFKWGLVASVAPPCYETRVAILKNKARLRGLEMPDEVACHIAARVETNIRELEGVVVKLQVLSGVEKRGLDLDLAKAALGEEPERSDRQIQIQVIINAVTEFFGIKMTDLQSKKRHRSITLPRQVCMYLARKFTRHSLEEIGGYFGGRDHTTVMHAVTSVKEKMEQEAGFDQIIHSLEEVVRAPAA
jgi:chromosomal replication initiator protein